MKRLWAGFAVALLAVSAAGAAVLLGGGLTTPEGEALTIALAPGTRITRGKAAVPAGDIHAGERAIVHAKPSAGQFEATEVKLAEAPKKN